MGFFVDADGGVDGVAHRLLAGLTGGDLVTFSLDHVGIVRFLVLVGLRVLRGDIIIDALLIGVRGCHIGFDGGDRGHHLILGDGVPVHGRRHRWNLAGIIREAGRSSSYQQNRSQSKFLQHVSFDSLLVPLFAAGVKHSAPPRAKSGFCLEWWLFWQEMASELWLRGRRRCPLELGPEAVGEAQKQCQNHKAQAETIKSVGAVRTR